MEIIVNKDIFLKNISFEDSAIIYKKTDEFRDSLRVWLPWIDITKSIKDTESFIDSLLNSKCQKKDLVFVIKYKNNFAGLIGLKEIDNNNHRTEMGYWLLPCYEGNGIMTLSCKAITDYAFKHLGINRIQIKCAVENIKSINIPKRLNYQFEGIEREGEYLNGKYVDLNLYCVLKKDWKF